MVSNQPSLTVFIVLWSSRILRCSTCLSDSADDWAACRGAAGNRKCFPATFTNTENKPINFNEAMKTFFFKSYFQTFSLSISASLSTTTCWSLPSALLTSSFSFTPSEDAFRL